MLVRLCKQNQSLQKLPRSLDKPSPSSSVLTIRDHALFLQTQKSEKTVEMRDTDIMERKDYEKKK